MFGIQQMFIINLSKLNNMKANVHYSSVKPVAPEPTGRDILKAFSYIIASFVVTVLLLAGVDLIDQLLLWLK